ncbi:MAG TPA: PstS family phosphate ABC transporter substrate-binding protein [Gaiellaceae bacterium]|nr:PstS family phosphate ABC transporter substrate-binding protein [Gaiellaceae bacterium]
MRLARTLAFTATLAAVAASTVSAGGSAFSGTITADGSSTLGPYTTAAAEGFQKKNPKARVTVGISGTGGGFERFCKGETDISNASRKIKQGPGSEAEKCKSAGIGYIAFAAANDGISMVTNPDNTWASCLTMGELKKIWEPGSKIDSWRDIRASFPDVKLKLFGPGTDSGTFDFFTEHVVGKARASRADYQASEDDNVLVAGVSGEKGGLGYFGLSYYEENKDKLKVLGVDKGSGCVKPNTQTVQNRSYPISRGLFLYVKKTSFKRPVVQGFVDYILDNSKAIAVKAAFVPLTKAQLKTAKRLYKYAVLNAKKG